MAAPEEVRFVRGNDRIRQLAERLGIATRAEMAGAGQIPAGCICAYTWHPAGGGLIVRNGPVLACPADHDATGGAGRGAC